MSEASRAKHAHYRCTGGALSNTSKASEGRIQLHSPVHASRIGNLQVSPTSAGGIFGKQASTAATVLAIPHAATTLYAIKKLDSFGWKRPARPYMIPEPIMLAP